MPICQNLHNAHQYTKLFALKIPLNMSGTFNDESGVYWNSETI